MEICKNNTTQQKMIKDKLLLTIQLPEVLTKIDSVFENNGQKGKVAVTFNVLEQDLRWKKSMFYLGQILKQPTGTVIVFLDRKIWFKIAGWRKFGIQYFLLPTAHQIYFNYVKYRAGVFLLELITLLWIIIFLYIPYHLAEHFPLKLKHNFYDYQYSFMNLAFEYGNRGNNSNNITGKYF